MIDAPAPIEPGAGPAMQRTRQEILRILRARGERTVRELAADLGLTQMSIRLHLGVLRREGLVAGREVQQRIGRPSLAYRLSEAGEELFPRAYWQLAEDLLAAAAQTGGPVAVEALLERVMAQIAARHALRTAGKPLDERVRALVDVLCEEGFMAEAERQPDGYALRAGNCPYGRVARAHPSLCDAECRFLGQALGTTVERTHFRLRGDLHCEYRVPLSAAS